MMSPQLSHSCQEIAQHLRTAQRTLFITGAGISADSGLPTYRGLGGLYESSLTEEGYRIEEALSGQMLLQRPEITWKYLAEIERNCRTAGPNAAHHHIAHLERVLPHVTILTQNIDSLHHQAGSQRIIEIHGNLRQLECLGCHARLHINTLANGPLPPVCGHCGNLMRPQVVLFGEALPEEALATYVDELEKGFDLVFSIGTTSAFPYIAEPVVQAIQAGIPTVEINPKATRLTPYVDHALPLGAAEALNTILQYFTDGATISRSTPD